MSPRNIALKIGLTHKREMIAMAYWLDSKTVPGSPRELMPEARPEIRSEVRRPSTLMTILYGGRRFVTRREMAELFLRHAREVIESGESQLVPLRHVAGIELVLISRLTPYSLGDPDSGES